MIIIHKKVKIFLIILISFWLISFLLKNIINSIYNNYLLSIELNKIEKIITLNSNEIKEKEDKRLEKEKKEAIEKIVEKYSKERLKVNKQIEDQTISYINELKWDIVSNFYNTNKIKEISKKELLLSHSNFIKEKQFDINNIFIEKPFNKWEVNTNILETKKDNWSKKKNELQIKDFSKKQNLELKIEKIWENISKITHLPILKQWYTFNSFSNYSKNWINFYWSYYNLHLWIDYKTNTLVNIPLYFPTDKHGVVYKADYSDAYWNRLIIVDEEKWEMFEYIHLDTIAVKKWNTVLGWKKIWVTWNTWKFSTWPHLHFAFYKDWFYVPLDLWFDIDNTFILNNTKRLNNKEIEIIINAWKENPHLFIENIVWLYLSLDKTNKNTNTLNKIIELYKDAFSKNLYTIKEVIEDNKDFFEKTYNIKWYNQILKKVIKEVDLLHQNKLELINKEKEKRKKMSLFKKECWKVDIDIFEKYIWKTKGSDNPFKEKKEFINFILPKILYKIDETKILTEIEKEIRDISWDNTIKINKCEIALLEIGKLYQETTLHYNSLNKFWIFQNLSRDYWKEFPNDEKKTWKMSIEQYNKQIVDSLYFSLGKIKKVKFIKKFNDYNKDKEFMLKYWLWSYHWVIWDDPNTNYYTSNNLIHEWLKIWDILNSNKIWYKDWWYTVAVKLYELLKNNKL